MGVASFLSDGRSGLNATIHLMLAMGLMLFANMLFLEKGHAAHSGGSFVPHRAYYEMSINEVKSGSGVDDVEGRMAFEWRRDCKGWIVEQRYVMRYFQGARTREIDTRFTTWESEDGKRYRFFVVNGRADGGSEKIEGFASHPGPGVVGTGSARFTSPVEKDFALPVKTLFPSAHTFAMLDAAIAGKRLFARPMFDGSEVEGAASVSAVIGDARRNTAAGDALLQGTSWPVRLAFFSSKDTSGPPDYEMSVDMHENGVASSLVLDYGEFSVNVELKTLERVADPTC